MKRKSVPGGGAALLLVKSLALAAVDCASVFIAFAAAPGFHIGNFPWALLNLLVVLVFADTTVLLYPYLKRRYGASYARGWCLATGGYYLLTMVLTPLFYWRTPGPLFTAMVGGALALYAAAVAAILLTRNKRRRRRDTQVNGGVIALSMLELGGSVHELQSLLPPRQWEGLNKAYVALRTCWEFAAPLRAQRYAGGAGAGGGHRLPRERRVPSGAGLVRRLFRAGFSSRGP